MDIDRAPAGGRAELSNRPRRTGQQTAGGGEGRRRHQGAVTGSQHIGALGTLVVDVLIGAGFTELDIKVKSKLEPTSDITYVPTQERWLYVAALKTSSRVRSSGAPFAFSSLFVNQHDVAGLNSAFGDNHLAVGRPGEAKNRLGRKIR